MINSEIKNTGDTVLTEGRRHRARCRIIFGLALLLAASVLVSLAVGRFSISIKEVIGIIWSCTFGRFFPSEPFWTEQTANVLLNIRLPRILGAVLAGLSLSLSGAVYQGIFKNPLVSPDLLGVSAGACVGASLAILMHLGSFEIQIFALFFGLAAVGITCLIPRILKNRTNLMLVLSGVIVAGIMNSIQGFIKYTADPEDELPSIVYWTMGSLSSVRMQDALMVGIPIIISAAVLIMLRWQINLLSLGEDEALSLGVNVRLLNGTAILCSTVLTACAVCISGTIGWIGLVVPHIGRLIVGSNNRYLFPAALLGGGIFLTVVDTLARNLNTTEVPLSILTGLIGGPLFVIILARQGIRQQ